MSGKFIFLIFKFIIFFNKVFRIDINVKLSDNSITHHEIFLSLQKSSFALFLYFKEGFPRVIGECIKADIPFFIGKSLKMGDRHLQNYLIKLSLYRIICNIVTNTYVNNYDSLKSKILYDAETIDKKLYFIRNGDFLKQSKHISENRIKLAYHLLTNDYSFILRNNERV